MLKHSKGFTLMELLIVLAIIAVVSAVIIPRIGSSDGKLYRVQLRTLTAAMNYNRRNAVVLNRPFEMTLAAYQESAETDASENSRVKKGDWASQGAEIQWRAGTKTIRNKTFKIKFFPQGGATGGVIRLQQGRFIAHLTIDGITGNVSIKESLDETDD